MNVLRQITAVFYPDTCMCCNDPISSQSFGICISCRHDLPFTNFTTQEENKVEKSFYGRIPLAEATALLHFEKKGPTQELMHNLKYRNRQKVGEILGVWLAEGIKKSKRFKQIDCIVPVPLHKKRFKERGYNQLTKFGEMLSHRLDLPFITQNLTRIAATKTQTRKFRAERWSNVNTKFHLKDPSQFNGKHVLLIDDIVTTGATVEACYHAFHEVDQFKMSLATMSYTK